MAKEYISIIQGDTLDVVLTVHNPYELPIEEVKFICKSLELDKVMSPTLEQDEDGDDLFVLMLTPEETQPL